MQSVMLGKFSMRNADTLDEMLQVYDIVKSQCAAVCT